MAIAIDSTGVNSPSSASSSTRTVAFTNTAGTFLIVGIARFRNVTTNSVTYNGVAMTKAVDSIDSASNRAEIWYLASPATGANNIIITFSAATDDGLVVGSMSFTGVNNTSPIGATANSSALVDSTAPSIAITTQFNNSFIVDSLYRNATTETATSPQTEAWGQNSSYGSEGGAGSYKSFPTAGATTMAWTLGVSKPWIMCAVEIKEAASTYTLPTVVGAFVLTGVATGVYKGFYIGASVGSFVLTGINALFSLGKGMVAEVGSFIVSGQPVSLLYARIMTTVAGAFTLTGVSATFNKGRTLVAGVGTFILTGVSAILRPSNIWTAQNKNTSTFTPQSKSATPTWGGATKASSTWTPQNKS